MTGVADCSQAEVDYTPDGNTNAYLAVADCSQAEVDYTHPAPAKLPWRLRIAPKLKSITLPVSGAEPQRPLRIAPKLKSITLGSRRIQPSQ